MDHRWTDNKGIMNHRRTENEGAMDHRWTDNAIAKGRGKKLMRLGVLFPNWISINRLHIHTYMYGFLFVNNTAIFND
jgi:hypothetical protein